MPYEEAKLFESATIGIFGMGHSKTELLRDFRNV
jgi:hypothetical protein